MTFINTSTNPQNSTTPRINPKVNHELGVIVMCPCRFILDNTCIIRENDADNGEAVHVWGPKGIWELSVLSPGSCCEPKTDLKSNILTLKT